MELVTIPAQTTDSQLPVEIGELHDLLANLSKLTFEDILARGRCGIRLHIIGALILGACVHALRCRDGIRQSGGRGKKDKDGVGITAQLEQVATVWCMKRRTLERYAQIYTAFFVKCSGKTCDDAVACLTGVSPEDALKASRAADPYRALEQIKATRATAMSPKTKPKMVQSSSHQSQATIAEAPDSESNMHAKPACSGEQRFEELDDLLGFTDESIPASGKNDPSQVSPQMTVPGLNAAVISNFVVPPIILSIDAWNALSTMVQENNANPNNYLAHEKMLADHLILKAFEASRRLPDSVIEDLLS
jgi:hypothetical protein